MLVCLSLYYKWTFDFFPQSSTTMDQILDSQDILCDWKSLELLSTHHNRVHSNVEPLFDEQIEIF